MDEGRGITRRALLQGATVTTAAVVLAQVAGCTTSDDPDETSPNILLVIADDMRLDFLRFVEEIDARLGTAGRRFTAARTNVSLCQPFRVGLLTGQRSLEHKVLGNTETSRVPHDDTLGRWVREAGYRTALIGKYLNGAPLMTPAPEGWGTWRQIASDIDPNAYERVGFQVHDGTTTTTVEVPELEYLEGEVAEFVSGSQPWFCMMTPTTPHHPFEPEPDDERRWDDLVWEAPTDPDVSDKPSWYASLPPLTDDARARFQEQARGQAEELTGLDRMVIRLLDSLPDDTLANTVVVFTSDNGMNYGEHRSPYGSSKNDFYEHNQRIPLLVRGPGFTKGTSPEPVSPEIDLAATIVALTGATASRPLDGLDLREVQKDPQAHADRHLLHQRGGGGTNNPNPYAGLGVSTTTRKLMRWTGQRGTDRYEAYDLDTDPNEFENWAHDPARRDERDELEAELDRLAPPPSLEPKLLVATSDAGAITELVTEAVSATYRSVVLIDVYATAGDATIADVTVAGDGLAQVELLATDERIGADGVHRRLLSFEAQGQGRSEAITITAGAGQTLSSLGVAVTEYADRTAAVQTVATGGDGPNVTAEVVLEDPQGPSGAAHLAVLTDVGTAPSGVDGAEVLHTEAGADPTAGFAILWAAASTRAAAGLPPTTGRWSAIASEIGT